MKILLATLMLVVAANAFDQEKYILKKWAMMKAFEGCLGKDNMKMYMLQKKQAIAKCSKEDYPMLALPMFASPYKTVGSLVHSAYNSPQKSHSHSMGGRDHHHHDHGHGASDERFDSAMLKYFIEEAVRDVMEEEDDQYQPQQPQFQTNYPQKRWRQRQQRDTGDVKKEMLEIGDRLNNKLQEIQTQMSYEINNFTCVLQECGVLNEQKQFNDVETIVSKMSQYKVADSWLQDRIESDVRICHKAASNIPEEILNECIFGPELAKVKCYKKCLKMRKLKTCMNFDIKQQLEENFAPLPQLVEQTDMEEKNLLPLVYKLLHGDEKKMF